MGRVGNRWVIVAALLGVVTAGLGVRAAELSAPAETVIAAEGTAVPRTPVRIAYGDAPDTFGDLYLPPTPHTRLPVVVLIHGGGWAQNRTLAQFDAHAQAWRRTVSRCGTSITVVSAATAGATLPRAAR